MPWLKIIRLFRLVDTKSFPLVRLLLIRFLYGTLVLHVFSATFHYACVYMRVLLFVDVAALAVVGAGRYGDAAAAADAARESQLGATHYYDDPKCGVHTLDKWTFT